MDNFSLPRTDWYDSDGRIYKDALIENFNAIENVLNELQALTPYNITPPDFNTISYTDVTLSSDDNKVVNLKSLIDILNLKGVPIEMEFTSNVCKTISYYNNDYDLITITDFTLSDLGVEGKNFIYLDYTEDMIYVSSDTKNANGDVLIGYYVDNNVYHTLSSVFVDLNALQLMADCPNTMYTYSIPNNNSWSDRSIISPGGYDIGYISNQSRSATLNLGLPEIGRERN